MDVDYRHRVEFWAIVGCVFLFLILIGLVRSYKLKERYSFLWFLTAAVLFGLTLRREWLDALAKLLGIYYPPNALFIILVFFMLLILIHFSTVISRLLNQTQILVQNIGLLQTRVKELEDKLCEGDGHSSSPSEHTSSNVD